jgi:hypothetical protein
MKQLTNNIINKLIFKGWNNVVDFKNLQRVPDTGLKINSEV